VVAVPSEHSWSAGLRPVGVPDPLYLRAPETGTARP
jgi:hypothetical protein